MKTKLSLALFILGIVLGRGHAADVVIPSERLTSEQIEELVSPIALYPDPLVALILPAATFPSDVVLAERFLDRGGAMDAIATQPWDDSVRALARYREVIDYLDDHLEWTRQLGHCFLDQPDAVMDAIQMVRIRARAAGLLTDTPEQRVIVEADEVCIVPAQPTVIYIPRYDPWVICRPSIPVYGRGSFITFGLGCTVGSWLSFDCDWRGRSVRLINRPAYWYRSPRWDDHDRYRQFAVTNWTRRTPYPHQDNRFDRPTRVAGYQVPGRDQRDWSERDRFESHNDHRPENGHYPNSSPSDRSRDWQNHRRGESNSRTRNLVDPIGTAVIPPVATPIPEAPRPAQSYRPPQARTPSNADRSRPDRERNDYGNHSSTRGAAGHAVPTPAPEMNRTRSVERAQPQPPVRRAEPQDRTDQRRDRDSDDQRNSSRSSSNRDSGRSYQLR
jgi:hypothetical protein